MSLGWCGLWQAPLLPKPVRVLLLSSDNLCPRQVTSTFLGLAQGRAPEVKVFLPNPQPSHSPVWSATPLRPVEGRGAEEGQGSEDEPAGYRGDQQVLAPGEAQRPSGIGL